jgi:hypothetical protein
MQTETGTPVQYMKWDEEGFWNIMPAVISGVEESKVDIIVFGWRNLSMQNVRHADFKKEGEDYWDFLPEMEGGQRRNIIHPYINNRGDSQVTEA